jgi:hypothetical protein
MRRYKYRALIKLDPPAGEGRKTSMPAAGSRLTVRAHHHQTRGCKFFSALVAASDPLPPVETSVEMTLTVVGNDVPDYLEAGDTVALWRGHDIGHGIITRRLALWIEAP